jgi:pyruvate dehydrogenase (quinone)
MMLDNQDLNQAPSEQRVMEGDPKFEASQDLPSVPYRYFVALIVLDGIYVDGAERWAQHGTKQSPLFVQRSST